PPMAGQAQMRLYLVELQRPDDAERVALPVEGFGLERLVHAAERHHPGLGAEGAEEIGAELAAGRADLEALEIVDGGDRAGAGRDVVEAVEHRAAKGVQPGLRELPADDVAEPAIERGEDW